MRLFLASAITSCILSLVSTWILEVWDPSVSLLSGFLAVRLSQNPGIAFGIPLPDSFEVVIVACVLATVCFVAWRQAKKVIDQLAFGLIIGGAMGNLIDRIVDGAVTDAFIIGTFPSFNIADVCICIGAGLLILESISSSTKKNRT